MEHQSNVVKASVFARFWLYFESEAFENDSSACLRLAIEMTHILFCTYEVMATITLSEVHNMSVQK